MNFFRIGPIFPVNLTRPLRAAAECAMIFGKSEKGGIRLKRVFSLRDLLLGLVTALFVISAAVVLVLHFRPLYRLDVDLLGIPALSGLPKEEILQNYDALIDYNSLFGPSSLEFPTLAMSETGRIHFEEVKRVFLFFEIACIVSGALLVLGLVLRRPRRAGSWLLLAGILTLGIPAALGILIALNWERVFVLFHRIVFRNDYWIFDAATDPVITILPDTFFLHCALGILLLVVLGSAVCFAAYFLSRRKNGKEKPFK